MAGSSSRIEVDGLVEVQRALRRVDVELPKQLRGRFKVIAERVAGFVRAKLPDLTGRMIRATKARSTAKGAGIAWRGVPYAGVLEFGGYPGSREYVAKGRYIYPTVDAERSQIEAEVEQALVDVIRAAGLEVRDG